MTIREKLCKPIGKFYIETSKELEEIADDYAIEFAKWFLSTRFESSGKYLDKTDLQLLKIFKKEKNL
jgi:hypothetical protein